MMVKSQQIRVLFLGIVYFVLLTAIFLPHHHHEETACYTTTHCEEADTGHDHHKDTPADHHHDHNTPDESQHCLTSTYYVFSDSGKSLKRTFDLELATPAYTNFLIAYLTDYQEEKIETKYKLLRKLPAKNNYIVFIVHELPMRAPPTSIV